MRKHALITGGTSKLGNDIIKTVKEQGFDIVTHYYYQATKAKELIENGIVKNAIKADFTNPNDLENLLNQTFQTFPYINLLINNAAIFELDHANDFTDHNLQKHLQINAVAPIKLIQGILQRQVEPIQVINFLDVMTTKKTKLYFSYNLSKRMLESASELFNYSSANISINNLYLDKINTPQNLGNLLSHLSKLIKY